MPNRDGTGPDGRGSLTGRGTGKCAMPLKTTDEELNYLKNQEEVLREQLRDVEVRVRVLEAFAYRSEK